MNRQRKQPFLMAVNKWIDLLSAFHIPDNIKSKKVLERCGFEYEITIEQGCKRFDGKVFDSVCYSILKSDYIEKKSQDK